MSGNAPTRTRTVCHDCGFAAPADDDAWGAVEHPTLGTLTRCPDCGSTDVTTAG